MIWLWFTCVDYAESAWYFVVGAPCPFCSKHAWPRFHNCPKLRGLSDRERVALIAATVRETLQGEPADQFVHAVYDAMENLESNGPKTGQNKPPNCVDSNMDSLVFYTCS